jgi:rhodanese-related sulfurtransferase
MCGNHGSLPRHALKAAYPCPWGTSLHALTKELDPDEHLVILCHHGVRSMNVTSWLRNQGFEQVQSLRGGIEAWATEIDPAVSRY